MKEELLELYRAQQQSFKSVLSRFPQDDLSGPFLMSPGQQYRSQKLPLLIVGQETNGWTYFIDEIEKQMGTYENYNVGKDHGGMAFWKIIRKLEALLGNEPYSC